MGSRPIGSDFERGDLHVTNRTTKKPLVDVRLVNLLDVALDTKSIRKVVPGKDAIPAVQFINTSVGPELDVLVSANLGRWHLTRYDGTGLVGAPLHRPARWAADAL